MAAAQWLTGTVRGLAGPRTPRTQGSAELLQATGVGMTADGRFGSGRATVGLGRLRILAPLAPVVSSALRTKPTEVLVGLEPQCSPPVHLTNLDQARL